MKNFRMVGACLFIAPALAAAVDHGGAQYAAVTETHITIERKTTVRLISAEGRAFHQLLSHAIAAGGDGDAIADLSVDSPDVVNVTVTTQRVIKGKQAADGSDDGPRPPNEPLSPGQPGDTMTYHTCQGHTDRNWSLKYQIDPATGSYRWVVTSYSSNHVTQCAAS